LETKRAVKNKHAALCLRRGGVTGCSHPFVLEMGVAYNVVARLWSVERWVWSKARQFRRRRGPGWSQMTPFGFVERRRVWA
jgi:hypothetical protein